MFPAVLALLTMEANASARSRGFGLKLLTAKTRRRKVITYWSLYVWIGLEKTLFDVVMHYPCRKAAGFASCRTVH